MSLHPHLDQIPRDPLLKILFGAIAYRLLLWLPGDPDAAMGLASGADGMRTAATGRSCRR